MFALPIFTARAIYRPAAASVRWTLAGSLRNPQHKKSRTLSCAACVRVTYFHGQSPGNYRRRTCA